MAHCPLSLSVGHGEPVLWTLSQPWAGSTHAGQRRFLSGAKTVGSHAQKRDWWWEGTAQERALVSSQRCLLTLQAQCPLCLRWQGLIIRNVCRVPRKNYPEGPQEEQKPGGPLNASSVKDLRGRGLRIRTTPPPCPWAGLSHTPPALCFSSCHLLLLIFLVPQSFCPFSFFSHLIRLVCGLIWPHHHLNWNRNWQPTPAFVSGEFHEQKSLAG